MIRAGFLVTALVLGACASQPAETERLPACSDAAGEEFRDCVIEAEDVRLAVRRHLERPVGLPAGLRIDAVAGAAAPTTFVETEADGPRAPSVTDIDMDGDQDVLIWRFAGNANASWSVWRNDSNDAQTVFSEIGEINGVGMERTADGLLAVPARGGAAQWSVSFYRFDADALTAIATVVVRAEGVDANGQVGGVTCALEEAPGIARMGLSEAAAEARFCAEPAAQVFE